MSRRWYLLFHACFFCAAALFFVKVFLDSYKLGLMVIWGNWRWVGASVLLTSASILLKGIRMYVILMEKRIPSARFLQIFTKTTLVTLVLPYKLGDFFRVFSYGHDVKSYSFSLLAVIVDRYFDSLPLLFMTLVYISLNQISLIIMVIITFILLSTLFYVIYPSSGRYVNLFLITQTNSHKGLQALALIDKVNIWHTQVASLVARRAPLLLFISILSVVMEYFSLQCLSRCVGHFFSGYDYFRFLNSIFISSSDVFSLSYLLLGVAISAVLSCAIYTRRWQKRGRVVLTR